MVSTLDSESSDPSSNLGGTYVFILPPFTQPGLVGGLCMGKVGLQSAVLDGSVGRLVFSQGGSHSLTNCHDSSVGRALD